jgi:hypothetical protein
MTPGCNVKVPYGGSGRPPKCNLCRDLTSLRQSAQASKKNTSDPKLTLKLLNKAVMELQKNAQQFQSSYNEVTKYIRDARRELNSNSYGSAKVEFRKWAWKRLLKNKPGRPPRRSRSDLYFMLIGETTEEIEYVLELGIPEDQLLLVDEKHEYVENARAIAPKAEIFCGAVHQVPYRHIQSVVAANIDVCGTIGSSKTVRAIGYMTMVGFARGGGMVVNILRSGRDKLNNDHERYAKVLETIKWNLDRGRSVRCVDKSSYISDKYNRLTYLQGFYRITKGRNSS